MQEATAHRMRKRAQHEVLHIVLSFLIERFLIDELEDLTQHILEVVEQLNKILHQIKMNSIKKGLKMLGKPGDMKPMKFVYN